MTTFIFPTEMPEFDWPVTIRIPQDGQYQEQSFTARFRTLSRSRTQTLADSGDQAFLTEVLIGWHGITDIQGNPIPYDRQRCAQLIAIPYIATALIRAYFEALDGELDQKN